MRLILFIFIYTTFNLAHADLSKLIEAVKADDIKLALELIAEKDNFGVPVLNINGVDRNGRTPLFYASSEEMIRLLFANDARLADPRAGSLLRTDTNGMNPLHFLLASTAVILLERAGCDEYEVRSRIERAAFTLLIAFRQELTAGWYFGRYTLENAQDHDGNTAADYLSGPLWRQEFVERLRNEHLRQYAAEPEGGFAAAEKRKQKRALNLLHAHMLQIRIEEQQQRRANLDPVLAAPTPLRPFAERPAMLVPEFATRYACLQPQTSQFDGYK